MKILHIIPSMFTLDRRVIGGAERYALELAKNMALSSDTTLLSFGEFSDKFKIENLNVIIIKPLFYIKNNKANPFSLSFIRILSNYDVIHCHQQYVFISSLTAIIARLTGKKVFVTDLGGGGWDLSSYFSTDFLYCKHLHISEFSKKAYNHFERKNANVIYGGVDTVKFSPDQNIKKTNNCLYVGRILAHKGIDCLIQALPPNMSLKIVGQGADDRYLKYLQSLINGKDVQFVFDCSDEELVMEYRKSLCIVLPSVYKTCFGEVSKVPELLGQTLLEGMACELPAVCTNVGGMPEIVIDGKTGFVVSPSIECLRDKLIELQKNPREASLMGRCAREHVLKNYTWNLVVNKCLKLYS